MTDLVDEMLSHYCGQFVDCGCVGAPDALYASFDDCKTREAGPTRRLFEAGAAGGLVLDEACIESRIGRLDRLGCDPDWRNAGPMTYCKVHYGAREIGASCSVYDLAEGDDCESGAACREGRCELDYPRHTGDPCPSDWPYCVDAAVCVDLDEDGADQCEAIPGVGDACLGGFYCGPPAVCDPTVSMCVAALDLGAPCEPGGIACGYNLDCEAGGAMFSCQQSPPAQLGEPCRSTACEDELVCNAVTGSCSTSAPYICWGGGSEPLPSRFP